MQRFLIALAIVVACLAPARAATTIRDTVHRTTILDTDLLLFESMSAPSGQRTSNIYASDLVAYLATKGLGSSLVKNSTPAVGFVNGNCLIVSGSVVSDQACGGGAGTVTNITTTAPITGGPITTTGAIACATCATLTTQDQTLSGGANLTANPLGTAAAGSTVTVDCGKNPIQTLTNGGNFTLAAPTSDGETIIAVTNGGSAGTITFTGFSEGSNTGDSLTTTNGNKFWISVGRIGGSSHYSIAALQ